MEDAYKTGFRSPMLKGVRIAGRWVTETQLSRHPIALLAYQEFNGIKTTQDFLTTVLNLNKEFGLKTRYIIQAAQKMEFSWSQAHIGLGAVSEMYRLRAEKAETEDFNAALGKTALSIGVAGLGYLTQFTNLGNKIIDSITPTDSPSGTGNLMARGTSTIAGELARSSRVVKATKNPRGGSGFKKVVKGDKGSEEAASPPSGKGSEETPTEKGSEETPSSPSGEEGDEFWTTPVVLTSDTPHKKRKRKG